MQSPRCRKRESNKKNLPISPTVVHFSLSLYKFHKRPSAMIRLGTLDRTLALGACWDCDPLIDPRLRPLHDEESCSFLFSEDEKYDS
jgi:hypothetical protein